MCVDAHIANCAGDATVSFQRNVRPINHVLFRKPEVYDINRLVLAQLSAADDEIFRLHVAVDQVSRMNVGESIQLYPTIWLEPASFRHKKGKVLPEAKWPIGRRLSPFLQPSA